MAFDRELFPDKVVACVLSQLDFKSLRSSREVCKQWKRIVESGRFWCYKASLDGKLWPLELMGSFPSYILARLYVTQPFNRNLIRNPCGQENLLHWHLEQTGSSNTNFAIENPPDGCDAIPNQALDGQTGPGSCFTASHEHIYKSQTITLKKVGLSQQLIDSCKPLIILSEWYAGRHDCGFYYCSKFELLDKSKKVLAEHSFDKKVSAGDGCSWNYVQHVFQDYPDGVAAVKFTHGGEDDENWAGHYGVKITGSSVRIILRESVFSLDGPKQKDWQQANLEGRFWSRKAKSEGKFWPDKLRGSSRSSTLDHIYESQPFDRNLIRNPCGQAEFKSWQGQTGGFTVEDPPVGCEPIPCEAVDIEDGGSTCFTTSYNLVAKHQTIRLKDFGLSQSFMNLCSPRITFCDWYAGRSDCGCHYNCSFKLLGQKKEVLDEHNFQQYLRAGEGCVWSKVEHTFQDYPKDVVYLQLTHGGQDSRGWAGHYGPKMTGSSIKIHIDEDCEFVQPTACGEEYRFVPEGAPETGDPDPPTESEDVGAGSMQKFLDSLVELAKEFELDPTKFDEDSTNEKTEQVSPGPTEDPHLQTSKDRPDQPTTTTITTEKDPVPQPTTSEDRPSLGSLMSQLDSMKKNADAARNVVDSLESSQNQMAGLGEAMGELTGIFAALMKGFVPAVVQLADELKPLVNVPDSITEQHPATDSVSAPLESPGEKHGDLKESDDKVTTCCSLCDDEDASESSSKLSDAKDAPLESSTKLSDAFDKNLIQNPFGKDKLKHWLPMALGGEGFAYEEPPVGCDGVPIFARYPAGTDACFATSRDKCEKEYIIDLKEMGIMQVINSCKPPITFTDWYSGHRGYGFAYKCTFGLLDEQGEPLDSHSVSKKVEHDVKGEWVRVQHTFNDYPAGVAYLDLTHSGKSVNNQYGHYGVKMTASSIVIAKNEEVFEWLQANDRVPA